MKRKFFLPIIAIVAVMGVGMFSAFRAVNHHKALQYYEYNGSGSATDQLNYSPTSGPYCASGTNVVCTILAEDDPSNPGYPLIKDQPVENRIISKDDSAGDVFVRN